MGKGCFVGPVGNAVGLRFDKVYLMGMVEGLVPPRVRDDPLLPDDDREQAGLPLRRGTAAERYEYLAAASSGRATVLTFARGDNAARGSSTRPDGSLQRHHFSMARPSTPRCCRRPSNSLPCENSHGLKW